MGTVHSQATVLGLVRLQRIDDERLRIERRLQEGPQLVEKRGARYRQGVTRIATAKDSLAHRKSALKQLELDLKSKETEVQKLLGQQGSARTNQEYKALGDHAERLKKVCGEVEDRVLQGMSDIENAQSEIDALTRDVEELRKEQDQFSLSWAKDEAEYRAELLTVQARREAAIAQLPRDAVIIYEKTLVAHHGEAVVATDSRVCGACRMKVLPNDMALLKSGSALVMCNSCQRILFVPGLHDVSKASG